MKRDDDLGGLAQVADPRTLLQGLFAHAPVAFQIYDASGRSVAVNPAFLALFGAAPPPEYNILRDEQAAKSGQLHLLERAFQGEVVRTAPVWYDPRDVEHVKVTEGKRCAMSCTAFPLFDRDGKVEHVVFAFRDVTAELLAREEVESERDQLREVLEKSRRTQAQLQAIVDYGPAAIYLKDLDGRHLMANREMERVMNQPRAFFIGRTDHDIFPAAQADVMTANDQRVIASRAPISCEEVVQLPDGPHTFLSVKFPVLDPDGAAIAVGGMSVDISDRILATERLRQSEERFAKYFASSPLPASISGADRRVIDVNPACERFAGRSRSELIGRTGAEIGIILDPADRAALRERLERDGFARDFEGEMQTASGRRRHVLISVERMELEGRPCVLTLIHDLTERVQLEEQLRHSQKMEAIGRLAGGIAHDFNNLLTALSGYNALVIEGLRESDPLRAYAMRVSQAAARASALTRQLLAFSRKQPSAPVELDLNALLSGTINMLRPLIGEDIEVSCALDPALGAVRADPTQLEQVIANLVINARDAMPKGGRLTLETANLDEGGAWVRLSVRDTGTGIDDAARARLFEPFFTTKEPGKGTGLGLALVYGIVEQCGGRVLVDSQPGQGALFEVRLPRLSAQAPKAAEASGPVLLPRGHETILLVEDDESVRELVQFVLAQKGYQVLVAEDGRDALAQAASHPGPIDLLISDVVMPHLDGSELAARLRELRRETRVLHISGYPGDTIERHGPLGPPNAFLAKPFSREALLARVRAILDEKR